MGHLPGDSPGKDKAALSPAKKVASPLPSYQMVFPAIPSNKAILPLGPCNVHYARHAVICKKVNAPLAAMVQLPRCKKSASNQA